MPSIATTLSFASLLAFSVSALNQCEIASAAWLAMGGSSAQGPLITNATACCNNRGIACDTTIIDHIDWRGAGLSGPISPNLFYLPDLVEMNLSNNALNGSIPNLFNMTSKILFVDFGNNRLTGSIPATLDALPIKGLALYSNNLSGNLPALTGAVASLERLSVTTNMLCGPIPDYGNRTNLLVFNVNYNMFSGAIPSGLAASPKLQQAHFEGNKLSGPIPAGYKSNPSITEFSVKYQTNVCGVFPNPTNALGWTALATCELIYSSVCSSSGNTVPGVCGSLQPCSSYGTCAVLSDNYCPVTSTTTTVAMPTAYATAIKGVNSMSMVYVTPSPSPSPPAEGTPMPSPNASPSPVASPVASPTATQTSDKSGALASSVLFAATYLVAYAIVA